jgi:hypothetical protein
MKVIFFTCLLLPWLETAEAQSENFHWLIGTWKVQGENTFEVWSGEKGTSGLLGKSFTVKGVDTVVTELISIEYYLGSFHYVPDVAGDQPPIDFTVTASDRNSFIAENPQHDFPKLIRYRYVKKNGKEKIEAAIEGNGKVIPYLFEKVQ